MNSGELYKLNCHQCGQAVEIPAGPDEPQHHACPRCGVSLPIDWRGSEPPREA